MTVINASALFSKRLRQDIPQFIVSADLGFAQDPTAIGIIERAEKTTGTERKVWRPEIGAFLVEEEWVNLYEMSWLERVPQRTGYPQIVAHLKDIMLDSRLKDNSVLLVDATGVGRPVIQMMEVEGLHPVPVQITGGMEERVSDEDGTFFVPKRVLVSSLQVLFHDQRMKVAGELPLVPDLLRELDNFKIKQNKTTGKLSYEAWRESDHDDMVLVLAMAAWYGENHMSKRWTKKYLNTQDPAAKKLYAESIERELEEEAERDEARKSAQIFSFNRPR